MMSRSLLSVDDLRREPGRAVVMGILNVTPDSFASDSVVSEAGVDLHAVVEAGYAMWDAGADIIDIGGESTRPNATRVSEAEELARVVPAVEALVVRGMSVSVDTMRAAVARAAVEAGAVMINDVSGGLADPEMLDVVASLECAYVAMHWRRHSDDMYVAASYDDVVGEVVDELAARVDAALSAGIRRELLVVDPGIGFSKLPAQNWPLLRGLSRVQELGFPVLVGASRKRFLGELLGSVDEPRPVNERDVATASLSALVAAGGAWGVRVHDVQASMDAVRVAAAMTGEQA